MKREDKKVVIVTGASSGIGLATSLFLKDEGYTVYGIARDELKGWGFAFYRADVTDQNAIKDIFKNIFEREGKISAIVNCAGYGISGAVEHTEKSRAEGLFDVNVIAVMDICSGILPYLKKSGGGTIVNIGSVASELPIPFQSYYSATKSAVLAFSKALSNEVKPFNVKVCCVLPGDTKTGFTSARIKNTESTSDYDNRIKNSVKSMEKDEENGMTPESVAKVIYKVIRSNNPPIMKTCGFKYKFFLFLNRFLPKRLVQYILFKMYASK